MKTPTPRARRAGFKRASSMALLASSIATASALAGPLDKNPGKAPIAPVQEPEPLYLGTVTSGVKTSDAYTEGNFSLVVPVYSSLGAEGTLAGDVLYLEPYTSWGEGGEIAASLGLGWRHLFGSQPTSALYQKDGPQAGFMEEGFFVGANVFIDMLDTKANNQFWQLGVGLEVGNRYVEVRGNYYIPLSDKQLAEQTRTRETLQSSRTSTSQSVTPLNDPYATGNMIAQDGLFTTRATTTTSTTTIDRLFRRYEEGMEGWDAELALLVPGLDKYFDLRLIGGYYSFDNQPFGPQTGGTGNVEGFKAGVEVRPVPAVILSGTWYEDDRLTGSDWTAGVQLQLPFEMGDLGDGKGFWGRIGDAFKPRRRHLAERMAEQVRRQNAAIKIANSVDVDTTTSTKTKRVTRVVSQRQGQVVLADDIVFVNNGDAVGNGIQAGDTEANGANGTAERPFNTITEGAFVAGNNSNTSSRLWSVYTQGSTGTTYEDSFDTTGSTRFISSFTPIAGLGGTKFGGNTDRPLWNGAVHAEDVDTLIVRGYTLFGEGLGGFGSLIEAYDVRNVAIVDNQIGFTPDAAIYVEATEDADYYTLIANNTVGLAISAVEVELRDDARMRLDLINNEIYASGEDVGARLVTFGDSVLTANISGNLFSGDVLGFGPGETGLLIQNYGDGLLTANVFNNDFASDFDGEGAFIGAYDSKVAFNFIGNRFSAANNFEDGLDFDMEDGTIDAVIANNEFAGDYDDNGIEYILDGYSGGSFLMQGNSFSGSYSSDILEISSSSTNAALMNVSLIGNRVEVGTSSSQVFQISAENVAKINLVVQANQVFGETEAVVDLETENSAEMTASIVGNRFGGEIFDEGIFMETYGQSKLTAVISGNNFPGEFDQVVLGEKRNQSILDVTFTNNVLNGNYYESAIELNGYNVHANGSKLVAVIGDNLFNGTFEGRAIDIDKLNNALVDVTIRDNRFQGEFEDDAINLYTDGGGVGADNRMIATITGNQFRGIHNTVDGFGAISLESHGDSKLDASITNNAFEGSFSEDLIELYSTDDSRVQVTISDNRMRNVAVADNSFLHAYAEADSNVVVQDFNRNLVRGFVYSGLTLEEADSGRIRIDGTLNPAASNEVTNFLVDDIIINGGAPAGSFFLNGAQVDLP